MINKQIIFHTSPFRNGRAFCLGLFAWLLFPAHALLAQPSMKFEDSRKNFGFVKKGELAVIMFSFQNTGNAPLIITDAKVECSCTSVDFPKQPVAPQQKGKITVTFDTKSVYDRQDRTVEIISNSTSSPQKIRFKGVVLKP